MKKLLVGSAAIALGLSMSAQAHAQLELGLAGHFKGYVSYVDQDEDEGLDVRPFDIVRETELHFTGETTLDNGLTVGVHIEAEVDGGDEFDIDESYAYFSGDWGRVNFGDEDGAAYLLQVAAPSADSNVDGIRQYISPVNYAALGGGFSSLNGSNTTASPLTLDYANDFAGDADKITYLSPIFGGMQVGLSYTPIAGDQGIADAYANALEDVPGQIEDVVEAAARNEGVYNNVGFNLGGGYTWATDDGYTEWNVGADLNIAAFGLGAVYTKSDDDDTNGETETYVGGVDYTTGPFKIGASYLNGSVDAGAQSNVTGSAIDAERYSGGVVYTFAPGMSFRGSVGYVDAEISGEDDRDATYALAGTQINF